MAISKNKTKAMLCNSRVKWDCVPELNLENEHQIEVVEEMKTVGYKFLGATFDRKFTLFHPGF